MATIWMSTEDKGWTQVESAGFALEAELQEMVFRSPEMLPLSGSPAVVALAREVEVPFTKGRVDVLGVESDGTVVLIEVKLASNAEAKKAIVAQLLSYAASLRGCAPEELLVRLTAAGFAGASINGFVGTSLPVDATAFDGSLASSLNAGKFRLVLVLDEAPTELVRLVGYLEAVSGGLLSIDVVTVSTFQVGTNRVAVPQRLDPKHVELSAVQSKGTLPSSPVVSERGTALFETAIAAAPPDQHAAFTQMLEWAKSVAVTGSAQLITRQGASRTVLTLRVTDDESGFVALWNDYGQPYLWLHGTVIARRAPSAFAELTTFLGKDPGFRVGIRWAEVTPQLLELLGKAYAESSSP